MNARPWIVRNSARLQLWVVRNLANAVTLLGFVLCYILLQVVVVHHREWIGTIFDLSVAIVITDLADGPIARRFGVSRFGTAADRLRDKVFQFIMFSFFIIDERVNIWLKASVCPLIVIELCLLAVWVVGVIWGKDVKSGWWGKVKMDLTCAGILIESASILAEEHGMKILYHDLVVWILFTVSFGLAAMSLTTHLKQIRGQHQP